MTGNLTVRNCLFYDSASPRVSHVGLHWSKGVVTFEDNVFYYDRGRALWLGVPTKQLQDVKWYFRHNTVKSSEAVFYVLDDDKSLAIEITNNVFADIGKDKVGADLINAKIENNQIIPSTPEELGKKCKWHHEAFNGSPKPTLSLDEALKLFGAHPKYGARYSGKGLAHKSEADLTSPHFEIEKKQITAVREAIAKNHPLSKLVNLDDAHRILGPKVTFQDLEGKTILLGCFHYSEKRSRSFLEQLSKIAKKYRHNPNFILILSHGEDAFWQVPSLIKDVNCQKYPVYQYLSHTNIYTPARRSTTLAYIINSSGEILSNGNWEDFCPRPFPIDMLDKKLAELVPPVKEPSLIPETVTYHKDIARKLNPNKNFKAEYALLKKRTEGDSPEAAEAKEILKTIHAWVNFQVEIIEDEMTDSLSLAYLKFERLKKNVPGSLLAKHKKIMSLSKNQQAKVLAEIRKKIEEMEAKKMSVNARASAIKSLRKKLSKFKASDADVQSVSALLDKVGTNGKSEDLVD